MRACAYRPADKKLWTMPDSLSRAARSSASLGRGGSGGMALCGMPNVLASHAIWRYASAQRSRVASPTPPPSRQSISHSAAGPALCGGSAAAAAAGVVAAAGGAYEGPGSSGAAAVRTVGWGGSCARGPVSPLSPCPPPCAPTVGRQLQRRAPRRRGCVPLLLLLPPPRCWVGPRGGGGRRARGWRARHARLHAAPSADPRCAHTKRPGTARRERGSGRQSSGLR